MIPIDAYIGIGSNVGDAAGNVRKAIALLEAVGTINKVSSLYRTQPWGVTEQAEFCNAVVLLEVNITVLTLLKKLKAVEQKMGRFSTFRWGPRVIDLDILTYGQLRVSTPLLTVPHPMLRFRAFVLAPLSEIDPRYRELFDALPLSDRAQILEIKSLHPVTTCHSPLPASINAVQSVP